MSMVGCLPLSVIICCLPSPVLGHDQPRSTQHQFFSASIKHTSLLRNHYQVFIPHVPYRKQSTPIGTSLPSHTSKRLPAPPFFLQLFVFLLIWTTLAWITQAAVGWVGLAGCLGWLVVGWFGFGFVGWAWFGWLVWLVKSMADMVLLGIYVDQWRFGSPIQSPWAAPTISNHCAVRWDFQGSNDQ